jgi:outer membrane protein OmpA-like peptidoglycan-associated protein
MRGVHGYLAALGTLVVGTALGATILTNQLRGVTAGLQQIVVPGSHDIALAPAGVYTIFHEQRAVVAGRYFASDRHLDGLKLQLALLPAGEEIAIAPASARVRYDVAGREGASIATFTIPAPGTYRLRAWYPDAAADTTAVLAVGQGVEGRVSTAIFGSLAAGLAGLFAATAIAVATFVRSRRRLRPAHAIVEEVNVKVLSSVIASLLLGGPAFAQTPPAAAQPKPLVASVEGRSEYVFCDLTELSRTSTGELSVRFQYRNMRKVPFQFPHVNLVQFITVMDATNKTMFGVLKDTSGKLVSNSNLDGIVARPIPPNGTQANWARLEGPPADVKTVTVLVDGCLPFEDVTIGGTPAAAPLSTPAKPIATQDGETAGIVVELLGVTRTVSELVTVAFRYRNTNNTRFTFPHERRIRGAYFLDSGNRRKYEVLRDPRQACICGENIELRGQSGDSIAPGTAMTLWAKFPAPPASTKSVGVYLPFSPPFDDVPISGAGTGAGGASSAVAGSVTAIDAALKDLDAKVTPTEIRIGLAADVLFDFDKATIKKEAEPSLQNVATVLKANPGAKVAIEGHTDGKGADAYNQTLSEQRAAAVKQWLVANAKADAATIATRGWGKAKPIAHNVKPDGSDDPDGRAKNRRVEIVVRKGA